MQISEWTPAIINAALGVDQDGGKNNQVVFKFREPKRKRI